MANIEDLLVPEGQEIGAHPSGGIDIESLLVPEGQEIGDQKEVEFERGLIMPLAKNKETGEVSLALPEIINAPLEAAGNLIDAAREDRLFDGSGHVAQDVIENSLEAATLATPATKFNKATGKIVSKAPAEAKVAEDVAELAAQAEATAVPAPAQALTENAPIAAKIETPEQVGELVRKASNGGMGSVKATEDLARAAKANPEAKAAAGRLGIELPPDVFTDAQMVREAAGLTRSVAGSEASAAWRETVINAVDKADEAILAIDGSADVASLSEAVRGSLIQTRARMESISNELYAGVNKAVPRSERVQPDNVVAALNGVIEDLGGIEGLTSVERKLYDMVTSDQQVTYGRLLREKDLVGAAIDGVKSPYGSLPVGTLKRLYGALADDQMANVRRIGGDELGGNLRLANKMTAKRKGLEKRIVNAFGSDMDGGIGAKLKLAVSQAGKGDITNLNKILKVVPKPLRREAIATAIATASRSNRAAEPGFGFAEFSKLYAGLRQNSPIYARIVKELGPDGHRLLTDLYQVSKRVTDARANVLTTGKANQALVDSIQAEGLVRKVLDTSVGQKATKTANSLSLGIVDLGKKDVVAAAGKMFASEEFKQLAVDMATKPEIPQKTINKMLSNKYFARWAGKVGLKKKSAWLFDAIKRDVITLAEKAALNEQLPNEPFIEDEGR